MPNTFPESLVSQILDKRCGNIKFIRLILGGSRVSDLENWFYVQYSVDSFIDRCSQLARALANFIKMIQQEDISLLDNYDCMREVK